MRWAAVVLIILLFLPLISLGQDRPNPIRLSEQEAQQLLTDKIAAIYPAGATITDAVVLNAIVGTNGAVKSLDLVSGDSALTASAIAAAKQYKYKPFKTDGKAVEFEVQITISFWPAHSGTGAIIGGTISQNPVAGDKPVRVSARVAQDHCNVCDGPKYPPLARSQRVEGSVVLEALIDKQGFIESIAVVSGDELLAPGAIEAVQKWRYNPYMIGDQPVAVKTLITVNFILAKN